MLVHCIVYDHGENATKIRSIHENYLLLERYSTGCLDYKYFDKISTHF